MLVVDALYDELMKIKKGIELYEDEGKLPVVAIKISFQYSDEDKDLYKGIEDNYTILVSSMMNRLIVCKVVCDNTGFMEYTYMNEVDFGVFKLTKGWLGDR